MIETQQNEVNTIKLNLAHEIEALRTEIDQLKSSKVENEKNLLDKNIQLNAQLKRLDESFASAQAALKVAEDELATKQKQNDEYASELNKIREKAEQEESQLKESDEKCSGYLKQINELSESLNNAYFEKINMEKELRESYETGQAKLIAEKEEQLEAATGRETKYKQMLESLRQQFNEKVNEETKSLKEKLSNAEIDMSSLREKLNEGLKDYRTSIDKLKQASNQRSVKMKKKLANCQTVLGLIEKNLLQSNNDSSASTSLFTQFLNTLIESKKQEQSTATNGDSSVTDPNTSTVADEGSLEFDENRFRELIENKRQEIERLRGHSALENVVKELNETVSQLREELETSKVKFTRTEAKLNVKFLKVYIHTFYMPACLS
jgi:chromosome segregation ATPase